MDRHLRSGLVMPIGSALRFMSWLMLALALAWLIATPTSIALTAFVGVSFLCAWSEIFRQTDARYLTHPLILLAVPLSFGMVLRPIYLGRLSGADLADFRFGRGEETILLGLLALAAFLASTTLGFLLPRRRLLPSASIQSEHGPNFSPRLRVVLLATAALSFAATAVFLGSAGVELASLSDRLVARRATPNSGTRSLSFLSWVALIAAYSFYIGLIAARRKTASRRRLSIADKTCLAICGTAAIFGPLVNGSRNDVLLILLFTVLILSDYGARLSLGSAARSFLAGTVVLATLGALRSVGNGEASSFRDFVSDGPLRSVVGTHNWMGPTKAGIIVEAVPERFPTQNGSTFLNVFIAPIPRALWPEKPVVRVGDVIGEEVFELGRSGTSGLPPGLAGELFLNFGWPAVIVGGLIFGAGMRATYFRFTRSTDAVERLAFAILLVNFAMRLPGGDFVGSAVTAGVSIAFLLLASSAAGYRPHGGRTQGDKVEANRTSGPFEPIGGGQSTCAVQPSVRPRSQGSSTRKLPVSQSTP